MTLFWSKRNFVSFIGMFFSVLVFKANASDTLSFQLQAGANFAKQNCKLVDVKTIGNTVSPITGANVGMRVERVFGRDFYLNSGVIFDMKGYSDDTTGLDLRLYYLTLPVHLGYRYTLTDDARFFTDLGPYVSYGIHDNHNAFDNKIYKKADFGLGFRFGLELIKHWSVALGADFGLLNIGKQEVKVPDMSKKGEYQFYNNAHLHNFCLATCLLYRF